MVFHNVLTALRRAKSPSGHDLVAVVSCMTESTVGPLTATNHLGTKSNAAPSNVLLTSNHSCSSPAIPTKTPLPSNFSSSPITPSNVAKPPSANPCGFPSTSPASFPTPGSFIFSTIASNRSPLGFRCFASAADNSSSAAATTAKGASVDPREAAKFAALAASWWRTSDGPFAPLHALNPARVRYIRRSLTTVLGLDGGAPEPLTGLHVLDVGCGGGILSESLARLGAHVHGIDVTRENVEAARLHAAMDPRVAARVRYDVISAEDLAAGGGAKYDVVVASEVLEHVSKPDQLLGVLESLMAGPPAGQQGEGQQGREGQQQGEVEGSGESDGGAPSGREQRGGGEDAGGERTQPPAVSALVVSTLNRTPAAWALAIAAAEYVTRAVPPGTHQWHKFITPEELAVMAGACGLQVWHAAGMAPSGPRMSWQLTQDLTVNYIATLIRHQQQ